jgi:ubiquinone/menaquinone biosynthesis C-methylase UbiE
MENKIHEAIKANIEVHSAMAEKYNQVEPHFRPESIKRVKEIIKVIGDKKSLDSALDLGCGTGFMINILKNYSKEITGIDVTQAMLDKVDLSGDSRIQLINSDTGTVNLPENQYDIATAYTFLDHLYDMTPTLTNAYKSLKKGGVFYADLSPNFYFWESIKSLKNTENYDPIIQREINAVWKKDEEIEQEFGVKKEVFTAAEYQKHVKGGLNEEELRKLLSSIGFSKIDFIYHWFIGQAQLINDESVEKEKRMEQADTMHKYLTMALPLSRNLFKYIGFIAEK